METEENSKLFRFRRAEAARKQKERTGGYHIAGGIAFGKLGIQYLSVYPAEEKRGGASIGECQFKGY